MTIQTITPADAVALTAQGARLVDIRSPDEFRRAKAEGAANHPIDTLGTFGSDETIVFMCKSGMRTRMNGGSLEAACNGSAYIVEGGLDAWRSAGLPVTEDTSQPLELMRQVQITAGLLILAGVLLGTFASPVWYGLSAFIGAGLTFAGVTGWCGMANVLAMMPWNRSAKA